MNILFIAPESNQSLGIQHAFERAGHTVFFLHQRINYLVPAFLSRNRLLWSLMIKHSGGLKMINKTKFNQNIIGLCRDNNIDFLFTAPKGTTIGTATIKQLRTMGIKCVNWFTENLHHPIYKKWVAEHHMEWDFFYTFDSAVSFGKYLPMGVDPKDYHVDLLTDYDRTKFECDVCFVGAAYPERVDLLTSVANMGVRLKIFGWHDWRKTPLSKYYHGPLRISEMAKAYHCARVAINSNLQPAMGSVNLKTFEIPASGGFELCDDQRDLHDLFDINKEIAVYRSKDDMMEKIRYYLDHDQERAMIAHAGHERVLRDHTLDRRILRVLDDLS